MEPMVEKWVEGVKALVKAATRYPQLAYHGFTTSLQAEWQYLSRCVPGVEELLVPVVVSIHDFFVLAMLPLDVGRILDQFHQMLSQGVKQGGLNLCDPSKSAAQLHQTSSGYVLHSWPY